MNNPFFCAVYTRESGELKVEVSGFSQLIRSSLTVITSKSSQNYLDIGSFAPNEVALRCKGLVIEKEQAAGVRVYTDPFCSIPVYYHDGGDKVIISSSPMQCISYANTALDAAGFWETILFGTCVWTRTPFKGLFQVPAACCLDIREISQVNRYWDFNIAEDGSITSSEKAAAQLNELLTNIFSKFTDEQEYYMGLSGGLDSRLSLCYLSNNTLIDRLRLFTYGFDEQILEYKYAKVVAQQFGMETVFHRLDHQSYRGAVGYIPELSAGEMSIAHCHISSCFKDGNYSGKSLISNYYSDAVFGYAAVYPKVINDANPYIEKLETARFIDHEVKEIIHSDIDCMCNAYQPSSNYSSIWEYIYVTERNPKFHLKLAHLQNHFIETITPYANLELLKFMISVPLKYREQKIILDSLFKIFYPKLHRAAISEQSSRFQRRFSKGYDWWHFRGINMLNAFLRFGTRGQVQFLNKFQTEEQEKLLFTHFNKDLHRATSIFNELGLLSHDGKLFYDRLPLRAVDTGARFSLITLSKLLIH